jgi:hypothetical protein
MKIYFLNIDTTAKAPRPLSVYVEANRFPCLGGELMRFEPITYRGEDGVRVFLNFSAN